MPKSCKVSTEKGSYYNRLRLERFAAIYTISLVISVLVFIFSPKVLAPGVLVFCFLIVWPILLFFAYNAVREYFSSMKAINKEGRFTEVCFSNDRPGQEKITFSLFKYFKETFTFISYLIIFFSSGDCYKPV